MPKTVLITGAGSGFGYHAAVQLAGRGHTVGAHRHGLWNWYVQGHGYFNGPNGALQQIFAHNADAGNTVIELTDLTYG